MPDFSNAERLSVYTHLRTIESDFDKAQGQIRAICSAWSAAVLGAVGLIAINAFTPAANAPDLAERAAHLAYLRALICMIGSAGVFAFWFIDQRVYQKLLHSIFAYGLHVELKHPDLPQIRSSLLIAHHDITNGLSWFYRMQFWLFLVIALVFVLRPFSIDLGPTPPGIKSFTEIHAFGVLLGEIVSRRWPSLTKIVREIYPELWAAWPPRPVPWWLEYLWAPQPLADQEARRAAWEARVMAIPVMAAPVVATPVVATVLAASVMPPPALEPPQP
jgi:hypothetical protein